MENEIGGGNGNGEGLFVPVPVPPYGHLYLHDLSATFLHFLLCWLWRILLMFKASPMFRFLIIFPTGR